MNKIKVLNVGLTSAVGGIETYMYNLYNQLDKEKIEASFLINYNEKVYKYEELSKQGCNFYYITNRRKNFVRYIFDLKKVYKSNNFDYIHFHTSKFSNFFKYLFAIKYSNAKIIIHSHQFRTKKIKNIFTRILDFIGRKLISNKKIYAAACSKEAYEYMFKDFKKIINNEPIIFNNGIDLNKFSFSENARIRIRKSLNLNDEILYGNVGRLSLQKNQDFLIDIYNNIYKLNPNSKLIILGDGELKDNLITKVKELNLEKNIIFLGNKENVEEYMSAMDALIFPSLYEGFGLVLIEAQACNLKIFASADVIPKETRVSDLLKFISLKKSSEEWANIITSESLTKKNVHEEIINNKFDINSASKMVENFYLKNMK
jgi:glycosyltransferase involved in cell wall biosynthesis